MHFFRWRGTSRRVAASHHCRKMVSMHAPYHANGTHVRFSASYEPLEFADATFSRELLPGRPHSGGDRRACSQARKPPRESFSGRTAGLSTRQRLADATGRARARRRCASFLRRVRYTRLAVGGIVKDF